LFSITSIMPSFKELLAANEPIRVFAISKLPHPLVIEMFALAGGYHGFWLDLEHAFLSTEQIMMAALTARANNFDCFVRLPPSGYWQVTQCLEAGASGVMAAQIRTATQAEEFVSWCKFAPTGVRGLNVGGRDANYTHTPAAEFVQRANERVLIAIQIETASALEQVDDIAALPGVDILFIGPADLSLSLGVAGQFHDVTLWDGIERVAAAARRHNKAWGCVAPDAKFDDTAPALG
jgi:2-dehydro-3-deoxyglucarate aldolase/4-hydroxy-2-oxoheptanedioate aldolase